MHSKFRDLLIAAFLIWSVAPSATATDAEGFLCALATWPISAREYALEIAAHPELLRSLETGVAPPEEFDSARARAAYEYFQSHEKRLALLRSNPRLVARAGDYYERHPAAARSALRGLEKNPGRVRAILGMTDAGEGFEERTHKDPALAREEAQILKSHPEWRNEAWNSAARTHFVLARSAQYPHYAKALQRFADKHPDRVEAKWRQDALQQPRRVSHPATDRKRRATRGRPSKRTRRFQRPERSQYQH